MAINYGNLFGALGPYVGEINDFVGYIGDVDTRLGDIQTGLDTGNFIAQNDDEYEKHNSRKQFLLSCILDLQRDATNVLTDRENVIEELELGDDNSTEAVLRELITDMNTNSESLTASAVTVGAVSATTENANVGAVLLGKVLDGVSEPHPGFAAHRGYLGLNSQLSTTENMWLRCVADKDTGGTAGSERFELGGNPSTTTGYILENYGSGTSSASIVPIQSSTTGNLDFETWGTSTLTNWDIITGTYNTHVIKESVTIYGPGTYGLKLKGDGALATIELNYDATGLTAGKRYCVAIWVKGEASTLAGTLTMTLQGTGYSAGSGESISMNAAALSAATTWTLKYFWFTVPLVIPDDLVLVIKVTGTMTNNKSVYLDYGGLQQVTYFNGVHLNIASGEDYYVKGDKFTWSITNDDAGVFQKFFKKTYGVQLPTSGSPTRSDTLAS